MQNSDIDVVITDCSSRDGVPAITHSVSTFEKVRFLKSIAESGIPRIESVFFIHPRINPMFADAEAVMKQVEKKQGTYYLGLVPDEIGCRRALTTTLDGIITLVAVSEDYNWANLGQTIKETLNKTLPSVFESARSGRKEITAYIQAAFGCPFSGEIDFEQVISIASKLDYLGADYLSFVDNTGMANPKQVKALMHEIIQLKLNANLGVHFHNTRGTAMANCLAALDAGIRYFETAIGGLSQQLIGSPMSEIGKGNVPTEDFVSLLENMGVSTGIDMDALLRAVEAAEKLFRQPLAGHILRAGPPRKLNSGPVSFHFANRDQKGRLILNK